MLSPLETMTITTLQQMHNLSCSKFKHWLITLQSLTLLDLAMHREYLVVEMETLGWEEGGNAWVWRRHLLSWEEETMMECSALLHSIVLQDHVNDTWKWLLDPIHGYSLCGTYQFLTSPDAPLDRSLIDNVWHKQVPSKVSLFAWCLLRDRIATKTNLARRWVLQQNDILCVGGCGLSDTTNHLFIGCNLFGGIWFLVWRWLDIYFVSPVGIRDHYTQFIHIARDGNWT